MTIGELANCNHLYVDNTTGKDIGHQAFYERIIVALGKNAVLACIPYDRAEVTRALKNGDKHLNTLPLQAWDVAGGFICRNGQTRALTHSPLKSLLARAGVTSYSPADGVCILKCAAIMRHIESEVHHG